MRGRDRRGDREREREREQRRTFVHRVLGEEPCVQFAAAACDVSCVKQRGNGESERKQETNRLMEGERERERTERGERAAAVRYGPSGPPCRGSIPTTPTGPASCCQLPSMYRISPLRRSRVFVLSLPNHSLGQREREREREEKGRREEKRREGREREREQTHQADRLDQQCLRRREHADDEPAEYGLHLGHAAAGRVLCERAHEDGCDARV